MTGNITKLFSTTSLDDRLSYEDRLLCWRIYYDIILYNLLCEISLSFFHVLYENIHRMSEYALITWYIP